MSKSTQLKASSLKTNMEFTSEDGRFRMMHHPDLGWGMYLNYSGDWEREYDMSREDVADMLLAQHIGIGQENPFTREDY